MILRISSKITAEREITYCSKKKKNRRTKITEYGKNREKAMNEFVLLCEGWRERVGLGFLFISTIRPIGDNMIVEYTLIQQYHLLFNGLSGLVLWFLEKEQAILLY